MSLKCVRDPFPKMKETKEHSKGEFRKDLVPDKTIDLTHVNRVKSLPGSDKLQILLCPLGTLEENKRTILE